MTDDSCLETARRLAQELQLRDLKLVLAESCTAGRIAATLGAIPGISANLCGSQVVYRNASKHAWLGISNALLEDPAIGPVSSEVSQHLAEALLKCTPEADVALTITGEIGPGAPAAKDGHLFLCLVFRDQDQILDSHYVLSAPTPRAVSDIEGRLNRLNEATEYALRFALTAIEQRSR